VLNVITTTQPGATTGPIIADPRPGKLSLLARRSGQAPHRGLRRQVLRVSMELGGNAPFLVFEDADLDAAVEGAVYRQDAQHGRGVHSRQPVFHVHASVAEEFSAVGERLGP